MKKQNFETRSLVPYKGEIYDVVLSVSLPDNDHFVMMIENYDTLEIVEKNSEVWNAISLITLENYKDYLNSISIYWASKSGFEIG